MDQEVDLTQAVNGSAPKEKRPQAIRALKSVHREHGKMLGRFQAGLISAGDFQAWCAGVKVSIALDEKVRIDKRLSDLESRVLG
jgi:hypothetical protein